MHSNPSDRGPTFPKQVVWSSEELFEQIMVSACEDPQVNGKATGNRAGVLAVGKRGCDILNALSGRLPFLGASIAIHSDAALLDEVRADRTVLVGYGERTPYLNKEIRHLVGSALPDILAALADLHLVFLIADMAEIEGCEIAPVVAQALVKRRAISFAFVTVPGNLESNPIAFAALCELQSHGTPILPFPQAPPESSYAADEVVGAAVVAFKQLWCGIVLSLWGPSTNNIDIEDMKHILSRPGCCVAGFGSGNNVKTAIDVAMQFFSIPSPSQGVLPQAASFLMVVGGQPADHEISRKMVTQIRGNISSDAMTCYGEYLDEGLGGSPIVFILACGLGGCLDSFAIRYPSWRESCLI
jgi:cell division GTPase FtsZ